MPTEKGMFVLDTDASEIAISGILHKNKNGTEGLFSGQSPMGAKS